MATGMLTANGAVSYLGELLQTNKRPNTILKMMGGLQGGIHTTTAKEFPIAAFWNLRAPSQPSNLEGAVAPPAQYRTLTQTTNVIQIFQEKISLSYLAQSDKTVAGVIPLPQGSENGPVQNPRSQAFQVMATLETIAQDANYSFLNGTFQNPGDPSSTALKTRGIHTAIVTNSIDNSTVTGTITPAMYRAWINSLLQTVIQQCGFTLDNTWALVAGVQEYANICAAYEGLGTYYLQAEAQVVGVMVRKIVTRWGNLMLILDPDMPAQYFDVINFGACGIVGMEVPNKGVLFEEPLQKVGSSDETQIYGQLGVDHGPEYLHGKMKVPAGISL